MVVRILLISFIYLAVFETCVPISSSGNAPAAPIEERVFSSRIKTIQLYPGPENPGNSLAPPIIKLNSSDYLFLEFDDLTSDFESYYAKFIHCDYEWKKSRISDQEFLREYNEFPINRYEYSVNTRMEYVHYQFRLPPLLLSGNYILQVYKDSPENVVFNERFVVYQSKALVLIDDMTTNGVVERRFNQQIDFTVNYNNLLVRNPATDIKVLMRQNYRWGRSLKNIQPFMINEASTTLEFRSLDLENSFEAGNEYRFFDLRSVDYLGQNVKNIELAEDQVVVNLFEDRDRGDESYAQYQDRNGQSLISTNRTGQDEDVFAEYCYVNFFLESSYQQSEGVHIVGELTNWEKSPRSICTYLPETEHYYNKLLVKQGLHFYKYEVDDPQKINQYEGSHFLTENDYDILIYYQEPGKFYEQVIGYSRFSLGVF